MKVTTSSQFSSHVSEVWQVVDAARHSVVWLTPGTNPFNHSSVVVTGVTLSGVASQEMCCVTAYLTTMCTCEHAKHIVKENLLPYYVECPIPSAVCSVQWSFIVARHLRPWCASD